MTPGRTVRSGGRARTSRSLLFACGPTLSILLSACVAPQQHDDLRHQFEKARSERDDARSRLDDERAVSAALREQVVAATRSADASRHEVERLKLRVEELSTSNREVQSLIEQRAARDMERPQVVAVRLPARVDQALVKWSESQPQLVTYDREQGAVRFTSDLLFPAGSDALSDGALKALAEFARVATSPDVAAYEVIVVGHTDGAPIAKRETLARHPTNWHLSVHRAISVKDALIEAGVPASRLAVMGYGPGRASGDAGARDRRVDIYLAKAGDVRPLGAR